MKLKKYTQEELAIIWENKNKLNSNQFKTLLPNRTAKAVKHVKGKLNKITDDIENKIVKLSAFYPSREIDKRLDIDGGASSLYLDLKGIYHAKKRTEYTPYEIAYFINYREDKIYKEIAKELGKTEKWVIGMAYNLNLQTKFVWTEDKIDKIKKMIDEGNSLEEAGALYNKSGKAVRVMLNQKGLHEYVPHSIHSIYHPSRPERHIINSVNNRFKLNIPEKNRDNADYYWGIIPPYEVDIPFYIDGYKFAIDHRGNHWHSDSKVKENDTIKDRMLKDLGYHTYIIDENMYDRTKINTMNPILEYIFYDIERILKN